MLVTTLTDFRASGHQLAYTRLGSDLENRMKHLEILLVEDSPSDARLIREALRESSISIQITVAGDGVEATDYLYRAEAGEVQRPDLVLLDLNLPRKTGREVLAEIKSDPKLMQIPVIVMTSSHADQDVSDAYSLSANCYIAKPATLDEYVHVVKTLEEFWFVTATLPDSFTPARLKHTAKKGRAHSV